MNLQGMMIPNVHSNFEVLVIAKEDEFFREYRYPIIGWVVSYEKHTEQAAEDFHLGAPVTFHDFSASNVRWAIVDKDTGRCYSELDCWFKDSEVFKAYVKKELNAPPPQ